MRCSLIMLTGLVVWGGAGTQAAAQEQPYETPRYTTGTGSTLDKNFGLPSFGMPNAELPQQKTMAPELRVPAQPDFFAKRPEIDWAQPRTATASTTETPLFTTPEESSTGGMTTGGFTTGETGSSAGGFGTGAKLGSAPSFGSAETIRQ